MKFRGYAEIPDQLPRNFIMKNIVISFIIPHRGRHDLLLATLNSIAQTHYDQEKIEVNVVTQNKSLDQFMDSVKPLYTLNIYHHPEFTTVSQSRNHGAQKATGEYFAFIDADIQLSVNWINEMLNTLNEDSRRVLSSAGQVSGANANYLENIRVSLSSINIDSTVDMLGGGNLFTTKSVYQKAGGFPEHLATCEDYYFTDKVNKLGDIYFTSRASFVHLGEDKNAMEMFKKEIWRGQSNLLSIRGRRISPSELPSVITPLLIFLLTLLSIIFLLAGIYPAAIISLIFSFMPILLYAARLYLKSGDKVGLTDAIRFYAVYFPARSIGTLIGIWKKISESN